MFDGWFELAGVTGIATARTAEGARSENNRLLSVCMVAMSSTSSSSFGKKEKSGCGRGGTSR